MKEHDWVKLYADADKFMKKVGGTDFNVKTNIKAERWGEALVTVDIPKRNNPSRDMLCITIHGVTRGQQSSIYRRNGERFAR